MSAFASAMNSLLAERDPRQPFSQNINPDPAPAAPVGMDLKTSVGQQNSIIDWALENMRGEGANRGITEFAMDEVAVRNQPFDPAIDPSPTTAPKEKSTTLTPGQSLGLSALSTGIQTAVAFDANREAYKRELEMMRDQFDQAYLDMEHTANLHQVAAEASQIRELLQTMAAIQRQTEGAGAQTLSNQQQMFVRNPATGGVI